MNTAACILFLLAFLVLGAAPPAPAQEAAPGGLGFQFQDYRLRNGLRVILSEDDRLPLVAITVAYGAGTVRERPGQEGLAYLLENLMFQGSENVSPLQHVGFIQKVGGDLNATTTLDKALFYETLPSNYLALALWLESDRMKTLDITPAAIEKTRAEILKEHQGRLASDPYLATFARFDMLLFPDFLYGHPLVGTPSEMMSLTADDVIAFYRTYYVPNNAVLCVVGNLDFARARELVARYFDSIPPGRRDIATPPPPVFRQEDEVVLKELVVPGASSGFHLGLRFYPLQTGDAYSLKILEYLLLKGETSRLRNRLLTHDRTAHYFSGVLEELRGVLALKLFCLTNNAVMTERSKKAILSEIDKVRTNPVSMDELAKAKRQFKMDYLRNRSTNLGRALFLVDAAFSGKPTDTLDGELDKYMRVNPMNLVSLLNRHFLPWRRCALELELR
jgi:predicted Zn-dependent peptidase